MSDSVIAVPFVFERPKLAREIEYHIRALEKTEHAIRDAIVANGSFGDDASPRSPSTAFIRLCVRDGALTTHFTLGRIQNATCAEEARHRIAQCIECDVGIQYVLQDMQDCLWPVVSNISVAGHPRHLDPAYVRRYLCQLVSLRLLLVAAEHASS